MLRRTSPATATLTGGDLSVDVLHTEDSVQIGDGTNLLGSFPLVGGLRSLPIANSTMALDATLTGGTQRSKITDGADNVEIDDVGGEKALKVSVISMVGGGGGGTAATDSAAYTATVSSFTPIGGAFDDTGSDDLAEGEMGMCRVSATRSLHVDVRNASLAVTGTFWQATQPVSGTFWQATQPVSGTVAVTNDDITAIKTAVEILDNAIAGSEMQVDVLTMPTVAVTGTFWQATQPVSGTFWQATQPVSGTVTANLAAGTNNIGDVDVLSLPALPAGTNNIGDVDVLTMPTVTVVGSAAHDNGSPGVPIMVAGRAKNSNPTAVADGDVSYIQTDLAGRVVTTAADRALVTRSATITVTNTTETTVIAAGGAGVFLDVSCLVITNGSSVGSIASIRDDTAGTVQFTVWVPALGGIVIPFPIPLTQTTANKPWTIQMTTTATDTRVLMTAIKRIA